MISSRIVCLTMILLARCIEVVMGRLPEQTFLPECKDVVAKNNFGFNAFRARGEGRTDYCCMTGISFHAAGDCEPNKPQTTPKMKCRLGYYSEIPNGALRCSKWACLKDGIEYIFDNDKYSKPFAVIKNGTTTTNMKCSCVDGMFLDVDRNIDVGFCRNVTACKPGEEVSLPASQYEDTICTPCKTGYFQPSYITTGKCKWHKRCRPGKVKSLGDSTRNTECIEDAATIPMTTESSTKKVVPTQDAILTEQPETPTNKEDDHHMTSPAVKDAFVDEVITETPPHNDSTSIIVPAAKAAGAVCVVLAIIVLVICCRQMKKKQQALNNSNSEGNSEEKAPLTTIETKVPPSVEYNNKSSSVKIISNGDQQQSNIQSNRDEGEVPQQTVSYPTRLTTSDLSGEHSEPAEATNETTVEEPPTSYANCQRQPDANTQNNGHVSQPAASPSQHNPQNQNCTSHRNAANIQNPQSQRQKIRNKDIFFIVSLDKDCLNAACDQMKECAIVNGLGESDRHDLFVLKDPKEKSQVTFGRLIDFVTNKHGIFFTPEEFITNLRQMHSAQKLIDYIQEIIRKYDAEH